MDSIKLNVTKNKTTVSKSWILRKKEIWSDLRELNYQKKEIEMALNAIANIHETNTKGFNAYSDDAIYFAIRLIQDMDDIKILSFNNNEILVNGVIQTDRPQILKVNKDKTLSFEIVVRSDDKKEKKPIRVRLNGKKEDLKKFQKGTHIISICTRNKDDTLLGIIGFWDDYTIYI